ncbi:MAG TPA: hypothetical protein VN887_15860 [Candidatus Angelobacter sp.]|nr:hypothetical protein [Candidatus Angelobacter sp.]
MKTGVQPKHRGLCLRLFRDGMLPKSVCGQALIRALAPLFDTGVVRWSKVGGGQRLTVMNQVGYERWLFQHFPDVDIPDSDSSQVKGVAHFRNAKALPSNLPEIVCLRSTRDGVLMRDGAVVETTRATKDNGVFAFTLTDRTQFALRGICALIENLAVFHSFEKLGLEPNLAIWTGGVSSNRFIDWLASSVSSGLRVLHLPDYDPVGLSEFLRQHERLGEAVTLFLADDLPSLFRRHCNTSLLADEKNQRTLMQLRKAQHPAVQQVVSLIDEFNGGLEHEAIFIKRK